MAVSEEEQVEFNALCIRVEMALEGATLDSKLLALTAVTARLCSTHEHPAELGLTMIEDLLANLRSELTGAPVEDV